MIAAMPDFDIDPDIRNAQTPPASFYTDPRTLDALKRRAFARAWQLVADADAVKAPGSVYPCAFLDGAIDEPLLLTRDYDDRVHGMANVCTHRGMQVCEGAGVERVLRCRYHGRRFELSGKFHSMPEFEGVTNFPSPADDLPRVPVSRWARFYFASLDPVVSLDEMLKPMTDRIGWLPVEQFQHDASRDREYVVRANWALYVDNYLEGFHIPYVHPGLARLLEPQGYRTELLPLGTVQIGLAREGEACLHPSEGPERGQRVGGYYFWLFPTTMLNLYPWGVSINVVQATGPTSCVVHYQRWALDPQAVRTGAGGDLDAVEAEDQHIVARAQRGVASRLYRSGTYSPEHEVGVHRFHRLLAEAMAR
jgi:choline monooxygenase